MKKYMHVGIDEAGRGCLCGPVCAASVVLPENFSQIHALADSKSLLATQREIVTNIIKNEALWGIGWAYPHEIDTINIHHASLLAMERSFYALTQKLVQNTPAINIENLEISVDGKFCPKLSNECKSISAIIKGDTKVNEIKAASILAKTSRDAHMQLLDKAYPMYGIASHKGYPTPVHQRALTHYGASPIHRLSFRLDYKK